MRIDRRNRLANPNNICRFALPVLPKERSNPTVHTLLTITHHIIGLLAEQLTAAFAAALRCGTEVIHQIEHRYAARERNTVTTAISRKPSSIDG